MLCAGPALHLFSATELERLVCGNPILDFTAFQKSARYDGGFFADHPVRDLHLECLEPFSVLGSATGVHYADEKS